MKKFIIDHPVWFAIGLSVFDLVLGIVIFIVGDIIGLSEGALELVTLLVASALPLLLIGWLGWWQDAGFVNITQNTPVLVIPLIVALFTLAWFGTVMLEAGLVISLLVGFFLTGLSEEALSRGLLLRALLPRGK